MRKLLILTLLCLSSIVYAEGGSPSGGSPALLLEDSSQDMGRIRTINFTGSGVSATASNNEAEVDFSGLSGYYLKLDQSTPQTVSGDAPNFSGGINVGSTSQFSVDSVGKLIIEGTNNQPFKIKNSASDTTSLRYILATTDDQNTLAIYPPVDNARTKVEWWSVPPETAGGIRTLAIESHGLGDVYDPTHQHVSFYTNDNVNDNYHVIDWRWGTQWDGTIDIFPEVNLQSGGVNLGAAGGIFTITGNGAGFDEDLTINLDDYNNRIYFGSTSGVTAFYMNLPSGGNFEFPDNVNLRFGDADDVKIRWNTTGNDSLEIGTLCGQTYDTGYISIMEYADMGNANRSPLATSVNPVLRIYSADETQALDYLEFYHNQTNPVINAGNGALVLSGANVLINSTDDDGTPATGKLVVKGSTNNGSTNVFVGRDSDEANVATLDTDGKLTLIGTLAVNGDSITSDGDLTLDPAGNDLIIDATGPNYAADAQANDDYAITITGITLKTGMVIYFKANTANTGACSLNLNAVGAISLKAFHDQDPPDNYIEAGSMVQVIYDGTNYQILSPDANP